MYKYKDRAPAETITILEDFFKNGNYDIKINNITESECGTWFCHIELWKNEFFIQSSNGKGINKEYCLASGLAELYERFCIGCPNNLNICYEDSLYDEEEKLTLSDIFSCDYIMDFFNAYSNNEQIKQKIVKIITNNKPVGLKYTSIMDKHHHIILEPRLMMKINGSQGMSAGNTLNEAIVQANCELYEKYLSFYFFDSYQNNTYYALNIIHNQ
jgi:ribosomal protein S12 methylthiotransferase accessory factor